MKQEPILFDRLGIACRGTLRGYRSPAGLHLRPEGPVSWGWSLSLGRPSSFNHHPRRLERRNNIPTFTCKLIIFLFHFVQAWSNMNNFRNATKQA